MNTNQLPIIKYTLNGQNDIIDPNEDLWINDGDIINECSEQAAKYAFYGSLHVDFYSTLEVLKNGLLKYEADNEMLIRHKIAVTYGEKERITEAKLEAEFARDEGWQNLKKMISDTDATVRRLEVIKEAFKQRSQQLWNIASMKRQENVGGMNYGSEG
jgi:hypothetical protein